MSIVDRYMAFLSAHHRKVLVFWALWLLVAGTFGMKLLQNTKTQYNPPPGTLSATSQQIFVDAFPTRASETAMVILVTTSQPNITQIVAPGGFVNGLTSYINKSLVDTRAKYENVWTGEFNGYFTVLGTALDVVKMKFVSATGSATFMSLSVRSSEDSSITDFIVALRQWCTDYHSTAVDTADYSVGVTGLGALFYDVLNGSEKDMVTMDAIVLPLALFVLGVFLASFRLILIPIMAVILSLLTAYTLMLPVALYVFTVSSTTPSIMMSLTLAMSFDYSLFLLSRYREEIGYGRSIPVAVKQMIRHAGHIVLLSGVTLSCCFLGLVFFPIDFLRTIGIGSALTLCVCIVVNLTLAPSLLLTFPKFFSHFAPPSCCSCLCGGDSKPVGINDSDAVVVSSATFGNAGGPASAYDVEPSLTPLKGDRSVYSASPSPGVGGASSYGSVVSTEVHVGSQMLEPAGLARSAQWRAAEKAAQSASFWYRAAKVSTGRNCAIGIVILVLAAAFPVAFQISKMQTTVNVDLIYPRDSPALHVYDELKSQFSAGLLSQYFVIVQAPSAGGVWSNQAFDAIQMLSTSLVTTGLVAAKDITSISYFQGQPITKSQAEYLFSPAMDHDSFALIYRQFFRGNTDAVNRTTLMTIELDIDPLGDEAAPWVRDTRKALDSFNQNVPVNGLSWYLAGGGCATVDTVDKIYSLLPANVIVTGVVVFLIVAYVFKSVFVPLRLVLTIALPICWVFGLSVLVYQYDYFTWISNILNAPKIYWLTPVLAISILVGLGLDYDLFLFLRVLEYREAGFSTEASMRKGLYRTGSVITTAGLIMVIAFGGMQFSHSMVLNQFSLMLFVCVIVDTFLVRTTLVPALVSLAGEYNWWPRKMPVATKDDDVFEDEIAAEFQHEDEPNAEYSSLS